MASKRYKILDGALDYLAFGETATDVTLPAGSPLRKFQEWRNNERQVTYDTTNWGSPGEIKEVGVYTFGTAYAAGFFYRVPVSNRALTDSAMSGIITASNLIQEDVETGVKPEKYQPARAVVSRDNTSLNDPNAVSKLTGIAYNKKGRASFTIPYGQSSTETFESEVRGAITDALPETGNYAVRFIPEKY